MNNKILKALVCVLSLSVCNGIIDNNLNHHKKQRSTVFETDLLSKELYRLKDELKREKDEQKVIQLRRTIKKQQLKIELQGQKINNFQKKKVDDTTIIEGRNFRYQLERENAKREKDYKRLQQLLLLK